MSLNPDQVAKTAFVVSLSTIVALGSLGFGVAVGRFEIWPFEPLDVMYNHVKAFVSVGEWVP
jgi:hypothetical protein